MSADLAGDVEPWVWADVHAVRRAYERWGFRPTGAEWEEIGLAIIGTVAGDERSARYLRTHHEAEFWLVTIRGRQREVVWWPRRAIVTTVLG